MFTKRLNIILCLLSLIGHSESFLFEDFVSGIFPSNNVADPIPTTTARAIVPIATTAATADNYNPFAALLAPLGPVGDFIGYVGQILYDIFSAILGMVSDPGKTIGVVTSLANSLGTGFQTGLTGLFNVLNSGNPTSLSSIAEMCVLAQTPLKMMQDSIDASNNLNLPTSDIPFNLFGVISSTVSGLSSATNLVCPIIQNMAYMMG